MIYARRRHERQSRAKRIDITRARSAGIAAAYGPTAMAPYATAFGIRPYGQKHCMPSAKTLYAIGKNIVCYWRKHSMQRAETSDGKSRSNRMWRRTPAPPTADGVPRMTSGTAIHPLRADETLACVSISCRCHWLSCPTRAERAARMLRISPSYLARLTAEPRKRRR